MADGLFWQPAGEETLVIFDDADKVISLNRAGVLVLESIDEGHAVEEIVTSLSETAAVSLSDAQQAVTTFVDELVREGVVRRED